MKIKKYFQFCKKGPEIQRQSDCFCLQTASFPLPQCATFRTQTIWDTTQLQDSWPHFCVYPLQEPNSFCGGSLKDTFHNSPWIRTDKLSIIWNLWSITSCTWHCQEPGLDVLLWFNHSWQLSPTQPLTHPSVGEGTESEEWKWGISCVEIKTF